MTPITVGDTVCYALTKRNRKNRRLGTVLAVISEKGRDRLRVVEGPVNPNCAGPRVVYEEDADKMIRLFCQHGTTANIPKEWDKNA